MNNFQNQSNQQFNQQQSQGQPPNKGLFSLPPQIMQFVPWIPLMLEMTTGQKIPQMTGTMGEIQQGLQTIQMTLGQIIQHQQQLEQRLTALESNASNQFTNLVQQVQSIKSIRLSHSKETKAIDYNLNQGNQEINLLCLYLTLMLAFSL